MKNNGLMIEGSIFKHILYFSLPLIIGNIFQQLYNTVDSIVVGKCIGDVALAAVNSSTPIIFLILSFIIGLSIGAGVVIGNRYGAQDANGVFHAVHSAIALSLAWAVIVTIISPFIAPLLLKLMNVNNTVLSQSTIYLQVYFLGNGGMIIYNMAAGILRAVGDSKHPLYYLIVTSLLNIILDITFVVYFHLGIMGVALATSIAQYISAFLAIQQLRHSNDMFKLELKRLHFDTNSVKMIIKIGLPSALQNAIVSLSNVVAQTKINTFGTYAMAGAGSYTKIDGFAILPCISFSSAMTTFTAQNIGAGKYERVKEGCKVGLLLSCSITLTITILLFIFAPQLLSIFSDTKQVIYYGKLMLHICAPGYVILCITHNMSGILRGAGYTKIPMYVMVFSWCICRIAWIYSVSYFIKNIAVVFLGWPVTWILSTIIIVIYYFKANWLKKEQV